MTMSDQERGRVSYPKFRKGTRVRVRPSIKEPKLVDGVPRQTVPDWATHGEVVYNPPEGNDYHEHPLVLWEDGKKRHVPDTWLERANPHSNYLRATCRCGRVIRASDETLSGASILCSQCGKEFTTE